MNERDLNKPYFKVKEFAERVGVHTNTIYKLIKIGRLNAFRMGIGDKASFRIPATEIERMAVFNMDEIIKKIIAEREKGK